MSDIVARFFDADADADADAGAADDDKRHGAPARFVLERRMTDGHERFQVLRRFGYRDPRHDEPFVVPVDRDRFDSDLASVPAFFRWLVPVVGPHTPAALLHDALVESARRRASGRRRDEHDGKLAHDGPQVDRLEADRIFRDAMGELGVRRVRRWLMWTAVVLATVIVDLRPRRRWWPTVFGTLGAVLTIGVLATLDLFDVISVLPWMGDRSIGWEIGLGAAMAVVIPMLLSLLWGRLWPAGMITCVALAFLLHVTALILLLTAFYWTLELLVSGLRTRPRVSQAATPEVDERVALADEPLSLADEPATSVELTGEV